MPNKRSSTSCSTCSLLGGLVPAGAQAPFPDWAVAELRCCGYEKPTPIQDASRLSARTPLRVSLRASIRRLAGAQARTDARMHGCTHARMHGRTDGRTDGWMDGWTDGC